MEATLKKKSAHYPKPGLIGGRLIRQVVSQLRGMDVQLPITSYILIAVSGGSDSVALAHLLAKYGRRVGGPERLALLHINHGWRGEESDADARFVEELGRRLGLPVYLHQLKPPSAALKKSSQGESWEDLARQARKRIYQKEAREKGAVILTAHQADDVAETLLWRLFTGAAKTHGGGIAVRHGVELRPFVAVRKSELQAYLKEEGQSWREDSTNFAGRFLRSQMRLTLMPVIEKLFPQAVSHLVRQALEAQNRAYDAVAHESRVPEELSSVFEASGLKLRRPHWQAIQAIAQQKTSARLQMEKGWELSYEPARPSGQSVQWILKKASREKSSN